jgi:hypothetical protein
MKQKTYHEKAQTFIKSAKAKGMSVKAQNGKIIAYKPKTPKTFIPTYGGKVGGKMSNGAGWGGEPIKKAMSFSKGRSNIRIKK